MVRNKTRVVFTSFRTLSSVIESIACLCLMSTRSLCSWVKIPKSSGDMNCVRSSSSIIIVSFPVVEGVVKTS